MIQRDIFDWDFITSSTVLVAISSKCQKEVTWKTNVLKFITNRYKNCYLLSKSLRDKTYKKHKSAHRVISERGKHRVITLVLFRDRVVQRSLCEYCLIPLFIPTLIYDNAASIKTRYRF